MATTAPNVTLLDDHRRAPLLPMALRAPATAVRSVRRHALLERLQASTEPVVALSAPAGYGKSTVLAQWAAEDERPFTWVRGCDGAEPAMLLGYIAATLREFVDIPMGPASLPVVCQALTTTQRPYVIVLDGTDHFVGAGCSAIVGAVADHLPAGSKLAIAGRSLPAMPLARLRAEARVLDLTDADLALTDDETVVLLNHVAHAARPSSQLLASIQGWPAGLALSVHAHGDCAGLRRLVADYLRAALMDDLDEADARFLLRTSVVQQLNAPLCDALIQRDDSARTLDRLWRQNCFLTRESADDYRFHPLLRDFLLDELSRREPQAPRRLRRAAADWYQTAGQPETAVDHALASGDAAHAATLAGAAAASLYQRGHSAVVEAWLQELELLSEPPAKGSLAFVATWLHAVGGRVSEAERWSSVAERATGPDGIVPRLLVRAAGCRHDANHMRRDATDAVGWLDPGDDLYPVANLLLGWSHLLLDDLDAADATFAIAAAAAVAKSFLDTGALASTGHALCAMERGDWMTAEGFASDSLALLSDGPIARYSTSSISYAVAGRIAVHRGDERAARGLLERAAVGVEQLTAAMPWLAVRARVEMARLHLALGQPEPALALCEQIQAIPRRIGRAPLGDLRLQALFATGTVDVWAASLTRAELRVLPLLATHFSFTEIGERLYVSKNTVKTHAIHIYRKLGVTTRNEAVTRASALRLIDWPQTTAHSSLAVGG